MSEWETVGGTKSVSTSKLAVGESFEGTFVEAQKASKSKFTKTDKEGNEIPRYNLLFENAEGEPVLVYPSGDLNYKIQDEAFEAGRLYRITRKENYRTKGGAMSTSFTVQVRKADGALSGGAPTQNTEKPAGKKGKSANGATTNNA